MDKKVYFNAIAFLFQAHTQPLFSSSRVMLPYTQGFLLGLHHAGSFAAHREKSSPESVFFFYLNHDIYAFSAAYSIPNVCPIARKCFETYKYNRCKTCIVRVKLQTNEQEATSGEGEQSIILRPYDAANN